MKWSGVKGEFNTTLNLVEGVWQTDSDSDSVISDELKALFPTADETTELELCIDFESNGYDSPGTMYKRNGEAGDPPEDDEERIIEFVVVSDGKNKRELDKSLFPKIFEQYKDDIEEVELDFTPDVPDPE